MRSRAIFVKSALLGFATALPAFVYAQTPETVDHAALATAASTGIQDAAAKGAPVAFLVMAILVGIGLIWRYMKRAAKS